MKVLQRIALVLAIIGAINWGLIGFFNFDLVATLFGGQDSVVSRIIYGLVGLSGLFCLTLLFEPWEELKREETTSSVSQPNQGQMSYRTEFGEEEELSSLKKSKENEQ
ncbi:DUF378 domain-containing protein [Ureibacillus thermophilus]|jgi:uncharacterized membrane protein YuzA (DUF378 family)|uniref:DUF378 domain-containing protein n=2 Tax=Ureibacillus TaxID=160795 RepID=A0A4P6US11_9BACL|nr:DUF378 domain-containing protein [Ureibacillus thermophilus]MBO2506809.1 DUF378 domain-containing protein [Bacilli bacterium]QBK24861.1 DUF378 domain-containing protein [Ureibacillus thermophilus]